VAQARRKPFLTLPWEAGFTGWIVVFGAILVELVGSVVTNISPMNVAAPVLLTPAAIAVGLGVAQWHQVRSVAAEPSHWWHYAGVVIALIAWIIFPIAPSALYAVTNPTDACTVMYTATPACVARASSALTDSAITWWVTGFVTFSMALLVKHSRIAAWASIPLAFAGCLLATHFLELLLLYYHVSGS
jgi:hypothetical protein